MKVRRGGSTPAVDLPLPDGTWVTVERNHQIEVPDDLGKSLIKQADWTEVKESKPDKKDGN